MTDKEQTEFDLYQDDIILETIEMQEEKLLEMKTILNLIS